MGFVFSNQALGDLVQRHWFEIMQLLAPAPDGGDEVRGFHQQEMLGHRLPGHVEVFTQFAERLPVVVVQLVEQLSPAFVRQGFKNCIHLRNIMQPLGCMSRSAFITIHHARSTRICTHTALSSMRLSMQLRIAGRLSITTNCCAPGSLPRTPTITNSLANCGVSATRFATGRAEIFKSRACRTNSLSGSQNGARRLTRHWRNCWPKNQNLRVEM